MSTTFLSGCPIADRVSADLPENFYEAQLDYFGSHMYDRKGDDVPDPTEGKYHYEWKPATER